MRHVRRKSPILMLGLGVLAGPGISYAAISKQAPALEKLPQNLKPLHKSLLFDQTFDAKPVRPFLSEKVVAQYLERLDAPRTPAKIVEKIEVAASPVVPVQIEAEIEESPLALLPTLIANNSEAPVALPKQAPAPTTVVAAPAPAPAKAPTMAVRETKEILKDLKKENKLIVPSRAIARLKNLESDRAGVFVIDESAYLENRFESVPEARVHWLHPQAKLSTKPNDKGLSFTPYPNAYSARYVVQAPGYLPAVGYAVKGMIAPVILYRESRLGPILKSLNQSMRPGQTMLIGKFVDRALAPLEKMSFDQFLRETQTSFYSLGLFGLFHQGARETGPRGDFMINELNPSLQYLLAKQSGEDSTQLTEWPAQLLDLKNLSPILTTTLVEPKKRALTTQLVDAFSLSRPETSIYASIGGQRGLFEPDSDGILDLNETFERPNVDLIEVHAQGYLKTWLNIPAHTEALPEYVPLFTLRQLDEVLNSAGDAASLEKSYVVGSVRPENMKGRFEVRVHGSDGRRNRDGRVLYFGKDNVLTEEAERLDPQDARFVVSGLPEGEWHIVLVSLTSGEGRGIQVVRTQRGTISQIQF